MRKKTDKKLKYDYSQWLMTPGTNETRVQLIKKMRKSGSGDLRTEFIAQSFDQMVYVVDYHARTQEDVDDLMSIAVLGVNRALNVLIKYYKQHNKIDEKRILNYVYYCVLSSVDKEIEDIDTRNEKNVSLDELLVELEKPEFEINGDPRIIASLCYDDDEYYARKEDLYYVQKLIKKVKEKHKSKKYIDDIFSKYFKIEEKSFRDILSMVDILSSDEPPTLNELAKQCGVTSAEVGRRVRKVLAILRKEVFKGYPLPKQEQEKGQ